MKSLLKAVAFITIFVLLFFNETYAQTFSNSSFESYNGCVETMSPTHSQFGNVVTGWQNALASNVSTADFFTDGDSCSFVGFSSLTNTVSLASNSASKGCSWAGIYLNYFDTSSINTKYREYIAQYVPLSAGITYTVSLDLARSNHNSSNNLEVDLAIYGYNGTIPAGQLDYCILNSNGTPASILGTINKNSITTGFQTFQTSFTTTQSYDYIVIGGANCGVNATETGYVFIDNVQLTASNLSILNPVILNSSNDRLCGLHCLKESFNLEGNIPQNGINVQWSQSPNNPEQVTFSSSNSPLTTINETGSFITGVYEFYYTYTYGSAIMTDTARIDIYEYSIVNSFTAGPDINYCNGDPDNEGQRRLVYITDAYPDIAEMNEYNAIGWWSMIRNDGTEWRFPNGCHPGDGVDEGDVFTTPSPNMNCGSFILYSTNSNNPGFYFRNPQDTVQFIWHIEVTDDCNTTVLLIDTLEVVLNDIDLSPSSTMFPHKSICQGGTMIISQQGNEPNILPLNNSSNLNFLWSYTPSNGGLTILNNTVSDSVSIIGNTVGDYVVEVQVFDANSGCSWNDVVNVRVTDCSISAGSDLHVGCDTTLFSNDSPGENYLGIDKVTRRRVNMNAIPTDITIRDNMMGSWWSMIRNNGNEWVFPNSCVPSDGYDEGDVFSINAFPPCGNPSFGFPSSSYALFNFRNALDTVTFIWHVTTYDSISGISDTLTDTVEVFMRDVDFPYSSYLNPEAPWRTFCEDTLMINQLNTADIRPLGREENLVFKWEVVEQSGSQLVPFVSNDAYIIDDQVSDSALFVAHSGKKYRVMLTVTDTLTGCRWMDYIVVKRVMPIGVNAGIDSFECVQTTGDYIYEANADLWYEGVFSDPITTMSTWWSVIQDNGTEWVFPNGCVSYDGADQGDVYVLNPVYNGCNIVPNSGQSNAYDCQFGIRFPGERQLIWHALDCTGQINVDTVSIGYGVLDQADAGIDQTVNCNAVTLEGNLSSLSSANTGYYDWEQLTGPDSVQILNSTANIGYFSTANLTPGVYSFKYTLGLVPCQTSDTINITVMPVPNLNINMISDYDTSQVYCQTDTINFQASGGQLYAFLVDGIIVQPFSPISAFSYANFNGVNEVTVLGTSANNNCIETLDSAYIIEINYLSPPNLQAFPRSVCEGEQVSFSLPNNINGEYNWIGPNGPMNNDTLFEIIYVSNYNEGLYYVSYTENNCFSDTSTFELTVNENFYQNIELFSCLNDSVYYNGVYYTSSVSIHDSLQSSNGCDSITYTQIVIGDTIMVDLTICEGDSVFLEDAFQTNTGVYIDSYTLNSVCDSIVKTNLIVIDTSIIELDSVICFGDSIYFSNTYLSTSNLYVDSLLASTGCDSLIQLNLTILPYNNTVLNSTICTGDSIFIFNNYENSQGVYTEIYSSTFGCDSVVDYHLILQDEQVTQVNLNLCDGDSSFLQNGYQNTQGIFIDTLYSVYGCDSLIETSLFLQSNYHLYDTVTACGSFLWEANAENYLEGGDYTSVLITQYGCDSIIELNLVANPIETSVLTLPYFCDSAFIKNQWYYTSQVVPDTLFSEFGCDSIVYIDLDIRDCSITSNFSDLYIPNVFTPNNDDKNDAFIITSNGKVIEEGAMLKIYNRWGVKLFESNGLMKWSGDKYSDGTYYYIFDYQGTTHTGHVNLIND